MPEAVIVDAIRTPIGRAMKGSLKTVRADELAAVPLTALQERNPEVDFGQTDDIIHGRGLLGGRAGLQRRPQRRPAVGHRPPRPGRDRQSLLRLLAADHAHGLPRGLGRRGRPVHRRRGRGGLARRPGRGHARRLQAPQARRLRGLAVRRLHPHGPDGRERRPALQGLARGPGRVGRGVPEPRRRRPAERALRQGDRRRDGRGAQGRRQGGQRGRRARDRGHQGRRPPRRHLHGGARQAQARVPRGRHRDRRQLVPAQRRRRRGADHVRRAGRGARPEAQGAHRRRLGRGHPARDHGPRPAPGGREGARVRRA